MKPLKAKRAWGVAYDPSISCRWRKNMTGTAWSS